MFGVCSSNGLLAGRAGECKGDLFGRSFLLPLILTRFKGISCHFGDVFELRSICVNDLGNFEASCWDFVLYLNIGICISYFFHYLFVHFLI